ncbi:MAG: hypothetical protein GY913_29115 [Proteobacteria bacterium]|nr:hypothetical protein [Pseudomonadota bacterium]
MIFLFVACIDAPTDPTPGAFHDALADPTTALAHCDRASGEQARGDCRLAVLEIAATTTDASCARLAEGIWRDECLFLAAERLHPVDAYDDAQETCTTAGALATKCANHIWRARIRLETGESSSTEHPRILEASELRLRSDVPDSPWSNLDQPSPESWGYTLKHYFRRVKIIDVSVCPELPELAHTPCMDTASHILAERLGRTFVQDREAYDRFLCRAPARFDATMPWPGPGATAGWLSWSSAPELRPTLAELADQLCD